MVIIGASGHALEVLDIIRQTKKDNAIVFFDPVSSTSDIHSIKSYPLLHSMEELEKHFSGEPAFVLGIGNSQVRQNMSITCKAAGGIMKSAISSLAYISPLNVTLGEGLNIMHRAIIQPEVTIEEGTLINTGAIIHHQSRIGYYCQVCPGVIITGNVSIGNFTMIGSGAVILPKIKIGHNCVIAANSTVTRDVPDNSVVAGSPAVIKKSVQ